MWLCYVLGGLPAVVVIVCALQRIRVRASQIPDDKTLEEFRDDLWLRAAKSSVFSKP